MKGFSIPSLPTSAATRASSSPVEKPRLATRRQFLLSCGAGALALGFAGLKWRGGIFSNNAMRPAEELSGLRLARRNSCALGSEISMLVFHEDSRVGELALDAAFAELARVEQVMSIYLPQSQVSRLNAEGNLKSPDPYLVQGLEQSCLMSDQSDGAFDITVQPLWTLYFAAQRQNKLPPDSAIEEARCNVDWRGISVSADEIRLRDRKMAITLNGIAQGFAADRAMEALKQAGIRHALVNTGEIASLGRKAAGGAWMAGIQHPRMKDAYLGLAALDGRCLSTSGDYETAFTSDFSYNHIFDPATGRSPLDFSSVTVVAPDATTADALSTAIFVLGPDRGLALAKKTHGRPACNERPAHAGHAVIPMEQRKRRGANFTGKLNGRSTQDFYRQRDRLFLRSDV